MSLYQQILKRFPKSCSLCFTYGSAVKKQLGYTNTKTKPMIDFIFSVEDPIKWHQQNLQINPSHYSGFKIFGSNFLPRYQEDYGAGVYFNTLVPIEDFGVTIKYGVTSNINLSNDLLEWNHLYLAGRLHKPVQIVHLNDEKIKRDIDINLKSALHTSLLLLPENFTKFDLFLKITSLSYNGDFRMIFGENKNKVRNIVEPQLEEFYNLYSSIINTKFSSILKENSNKSEFHQNTSVEARQENIKHLPRKVKFLLNQKYKNKCENDFGKYAYESNFSNTLSQCLKSIVWWSSIKQSIKNIPTAGITKSINYSWRKVLKTFNL